MEGCLMGQTLDHSYGYGFAAKPEPMPCHWLSELCGGVSPNLEPNHQHLTLWQESVATQALGNPYVQQQVLLQIVARTFL